MKTGQIGVITTLDATLWRIVKVAQLGLIVEQLDNPKIWRSTKPDFFWVLLDSI